MQELIKGQVKIHDDNQLELIFDYLGLDKSGFQHYPLELDIFLFLPHNLGINEKAFGRDQLLNQISHYIRVHSPERIFSESEFTYCEKFFYHPSIGHQLHSAVKEKAISEIKIFCCNSTALLKKLSLGDFDQHLEESLENILSMVQFFRNRYVQFLQQEIDREMKNTLALADEYIVEIQNLHLLSLHSRLQELGSNQDFCHRLKQILDKERDYQKGQGHLILEIDQEERKREIYFYRRGVLRKFVYDVLYLNIDRRKLDRVYRNIVAGIGAALAAVWATVVDMKRIEYIVERSYTYRLDFITLFGVGVLAYVFKDRIKELSRDYFHEKIKNWIPDFRLTISYTRKRLQKMQRFNFMRIDESFRYVPNQALRKEILQIRSVGQLFNYEPERKEEVINYYRKIFPVKDHLQVNRGRKITSIKEIIRLNLAPYLGRLDNPDKLLNFYDEEQGAQAVVVPKVYHINIVIKYSSLNPKVSFFQKWRVVVNKRGILRVEKAL